MLQKRKNLWRSHHQIRQRWERSRTAKTGKREGALWTEERDVQAILAKRFYETTNQQSIKEQSNNFWPHLWVV